MNEVHMLWHVREDDAYKEDAKLIGAYSSADAATAAVERLKGQPGFVDYIAGFEVSSYEIDKDHWCEGFVRG
jgi:hypothetical protein